MTEENKCPECFGQTIMFMDAGKNSQFKLCSRYKEPGHKTEAEIQQEYQAHMRFNMPRSGRFA